MTDFVLNADQTRIVANEIGRLLDVSTQEKLPYGEQMFAMGFTAASALFLYPEQVISGVTVNEVATLCADWVKEHRG